VDANDERFLEQKVVSPCDAPSASGLGAISQLAHTRRTGCKTARGQIKSAGPCETGAQISEPRL